MVKIHFSHQTIYNDENDRFEKSYANDVLDNVSFYVQYDNDGNIISDERNTYTYGEYGQLITVSGDSNASYSYDERGNILTKTITVKPHPLPMQTVNGKTS